MSLTIEISDEEATALKAKAAAQGLSLEDWIKKLAQEVSTADVARRSAPELPVWHLGTVGPLHRRDIYDDVR